MRKRTIDLHNTSVSQVPTFQPIFTTSPPPSSNQIFMVEMDLMTTSNSPQKYAFAVQDNREFEQTWMRSGLKIHFGCLIHRSKSQELLNAMMWHFQGEDSENSQPASSSLGSKVGESEYWHCYVRVGQCNFMLQAIRTRPSARLPGVW